MKATITLFVIFFLSINQAIAEEYPSPNWPTIKDLLFGKNAEVTQDKLIELNTPYRAADAAIVPIDLKMNVSQNDPNFVEKVFLIVDNNPSPIVGTFSMTKSNGVADLSTRIRVNANSYVRAIAQTADGKLHMTANYVKASGGCSAPAGADDELAKKRMGKMKLKQQSKDDLTALQLMISHPNYSGLQIDQLTRLPIIADYVSDISIKLDGKEIMTFNGGISISENPSFKFHLLSGKTGKITAEVKDSQGRTFNADWALDGA